jgi:hypothetical protein
MADQRARSGVLCGGAKLHAARAKVRFWVAAAAAGWSGPVVEAFLRSCAQDPLADTRRAAEAALRREYLEWNPL